MNIDVQPPGDEYRFDGKESDIAEVFSAQSGLRIVVSTWLGRMTEILPQIYADGRRSESVSSV